MKLPDDVWFWFRLPKRYRRSLIRLAGLWLILVIQAWTLAD